MQPTKGYPKNKETTQKRGPSAVTRTEVLAGPLFSPFTTIFWDLLATWTSIWEPTNSKPAIRPQSGNGPPKTTLLLRQHCGIENSLPLSFPARFLFSCLPKILGGGGQSPQRHPHSHSFIVNSPLCPTLRSFYGILPFFPIKVETSVTRRPPHGSRRAVFSHRALQSCSHRRSRTVSQEGGLIRWFGNGWIGEGMLAEQFSKFFPGVTALMTAPVQPFEQQLFTLFEEFI